jgi:hypothetical protein
LVINEFLLSNKSQFFNMDQLDKKTMGNRDGFPTLNLHFPGGISEPAMFEDTVAPVAGHPYSIDVSP